MNRFAVVIDGQQQMAGQPLFRTHKLRLVAQIPRLYRGEVRLRRLAGDIGKGEFQPGVKIGRFFCAAASSHEFFGSIW